MTTEDSPVVSMLLPSTLLLGAFMAMLMNLKMRCETMKILFWSIMISPLPQRLTTILPAMILMWKKLNHSGIGGLMLKRKHIMVVTSLTERSRPSLRIWVSTQIRQLRFDRNAVSCYRNSSSSRGFEQEKLGGLF